MIFSENKLNITLSGLRFNSEGIEEDLIKYLQIPVIKNPVKVINIKIISRGDDSEILWKIFGKK